MACPGTGSSNRRWPAMAGRGGVQGCGALAGLHGVGEAVTALPWYWALYRSSEAPGAP
eukprot:CAMPEP_0206012820 /NCGR_PEP_ID=MMETSP1464-20131121/15486_1 /ASSEMBLY_ACC=CAM_ASM_001124 /TAXON_ID=119497 /ORGANISM="Exanthemachrysis gayraliae, Strain RCC1523" /LENGTH=57 /DNA_ID=CAMNT_0053386521 /DNA_START=108 /DNA_END=278 /DNA_ORIENTATION=+